MKEVNFMSVQTSDIKSRCAHCKEPRDERELHTWLHIPYRNDRICNKCWRKLAVRKNKRRQLQKPKFRISRNISIAIRKSLHTGKGGKWETLVGYTISDLKQHLESQFQPGMSWNNYGEWHIDHIRPVSSFHFTNTESHNFKDCWALSNLQPLWARDNWNKLKKWG